MKRGWPQVLCRIGPLALVWGLAGAACVHAGFHRAQAKPDRPAAAPPAPGGVPAKIAPSRPAVQREKGPRVPKGKKKGAAPKKIRGAKPESEKALKLDPSDVLALQMRAIREQQQDENAFIQRRNRVTGWMDKAHANAYCWMDNAVRKVDVKWLAEDEPYNPELSTFRLRTLARVGGRGNEKDSEILVRFRADVALPGLEKKLHLYVDNAGRDSLPGADPMQQESDTRLGVRTMVRMIKDTELNLGGGLRWRDSNPVVYAALEWPWRRDVGPFQFCLNPRGVYYSDEGFGQKITLTWTRPVTEKKIFQIRTAERSSEGLDGVEFEQSLRFAWLRSGRGRGWVAQASMFPHLRSSEWIMDDYLVNVTWRDALYRKWIYYTLTPQVQFPREDDYEPQPSFRIGLEILFGGKIGELL